MTTLMEIGLLLVLGGVCALPLVFLLQYNADKKWTELAANRAKLNRKLSGK